MKFNRRKVSKEYERLGQMEANLCRLGLVKRREADPASKGCASCGNRPSLLDGETKTNTVEEGCRNFKMLIYQSSHVGRIRDQWIRPKHSLRSMAICRSRFWALRTLPAPVSEMHGDSNTCKRQRLQLALAPLVKVNRGNVCSNTSELWSSTHVEDLPSFPVYRIGNNVNFVSDVAQTDGSQWETYHFAEANDNILNGLLSNTEQRWATFRQSKGEFDSTC